MSINSAPPISRSAWALSTDAMQSWDWVSQFLLWRHIRFIRNLNVNKSARVIAINDLLWLFVR